MKGLTEKRACRVVGIPPRTLQRWRKRQKKRYCSPVRRKRPYNALTDVQRDLVKEMVSKEALSDLSCMGLSLYTLEEKGEYISPWSFWKYIRSIGARGDRRRRRGGGARRKKPDTSWVNGPNQLWCWDITYLAGPLPYLFFYLYVLMDWHSRFVVAWHLSDSLTSEEAQKMWDKGIESQGLLDMPRVLWPRSLSDRGTQMRSKSTKRWFFRWGIEQLFTRPRTPNDNARMEAIFATVKTSPSYPGWFEHFEHAEGWCKDWFDGYYNWKHPHSRLGYIAPCYVHHGLAEKVLEERRVKKEESLRRRILSNKGIDPGFCQNGPSIDLHISPESDVVDTTGPKVPTESMPLWSSSVIPLPLPGRWCPSEKYKTDAVDFSDQVVLPTALKYMSDSPAMEATLVD